jgi:DHA3 family macrolide efflux protein-like MFS transporter
MALFFSAGIQWLGLLLVCVLVRGFGQGIQMPTVTAILPDIVPADQLVRVNGFNSAIQSLSLFASPMLAAALLSFFPIQVLMYIDVVTAAIGIAIVFFFVHTHKGWQRRANASLSAADNDELQSAAPAPAVPTAAGPAAAEAAAAPATATAAAPTATAALAPAAATPTADKPGFFAEFKAGLRYMKGHRFIMAFIVLSVLFNVLATPPALLTPLQVTRDFGADAWRLGAIEVVFAVGMMLGGVLVGVWGGFKNRSYSMALATLGFGLGSIGLGLLNNFWVYLACMAFVGIIMPLFNAPMMAILQEKVDPDFMGRVFSVSMMVGSLAMPAGMLLFGPLADAMPIDWLLIGAGVGIALLSIYFVANRALREAGIPRDSAK